VVGRAQGIRHFRSGAISASGGIETRLQYRYVPAARGTTADGSDHLTIARNRRSIVRRVRNQYREIATPICLIGGSPEMTRLTPE